MPRVRVAWDSSVAFIRRSEDAPRRVLPALKPQGPSEEWDGHREQEFSETASVALSAEAAVVAAVAEMLSPRGGPEGQGGGW